MTQFVVNLCFMFSEKTEVFLEIFGNCEIRSETEEFLKQASSELCQSITNTLVSDSHTHPCLDTSLLKVHIHYLQTHFSSHSGQ